MLVPSKVEFVLTCNQYFVAPLETFHFKVILASNGKEDGVSGGAEVDKVSKEVAQSLQDDIQDFIDSQTLK